jgi:hypothetical protein
MKNTVLPEQVKTEVTEAPAMKKSRLLGTLVCCYLIFQNITTHANTIIELPFSETLGTSGELTDVSLDLRYLDRESSAPIVTFIHIDSLGTNVGNTFIVNSGPEYEQAVTLMTNGINDVIGLDLTEIPSGGGIGSADDESSVFAAASLNGIDLADYNITSMALTVDSFTLVPASPGNPLTTIFTDFTWTVSGSVVPIPPAAWLFGSGLLGLVGISRRRKAA